jgi:hypothetical protein
MTQVGLGSTWRCDNCRQLWRLGGWQELATERWRLDWERVVPRAQK